MVGWNYLGIIMYLLFDVKVSVEFVSVGVKLDKEYLKFIDKLVLEENLLE